MGSGYARLRCARRPFRNDAAAVRHAQARQGGATRRGQPHSGLTVLARASARRLLRSVINFCCIRAFPGLPSKVSWPAPSPASSRAKPERSGGADPGPIPRPSTDSGRPPAQPDARGFGRRRGMGSGYARLRCARRPFRNDAAAVRHAGGSRRAPCIGPTPAGRRFWPAPRWPAPSPGVIPGEAGAQRRRRPGTHSVPFDRTRAAPGAAGCGRARSTVRNGFRIRPPPLRSAAVPE
jgi:hypothetical protein